MQSFHFVDYCVVGAYLVLVTLLGKIAAKNATTGEGFFLAGRKLGKVYQFFLNFGHSTDATGAVSTASIVYQQGVSGVWASFQMIFLNPYYWFMYSWFRRVRLTTMGDLFVDRLGSRGLAFWYAFFQIAMAVAVTMAFCNLVSFKISAALVTEPEIRWTAAERESVENYRELRQLEIAARSGVLDDAHHSRLALLRERDARGELRSYVTALEPWSFYAIYTLVVGVYIVMGGMAANAWAEAVQGVLIIVFSALLIPTGLAAIGGWDKLGETVPADRFHLFGTIGASDFTAWSIAAVFFATLLTGHAGPGNMGIAGSARNEFAARFGAVSGTFGKRIMTVMWAFCGLISISLFTGNPLGDPDLAWGTMSLQLLGPGLLGLMVAGILAANMSTVASHAMASSGLFARNIYPHLRANPTDADIVRVARWTLGVVLVLAGLVSAQLSDVYTVLQFAMAMNVPFGAAILLMFIWRKVTKAGVAIAVLGAIGFNVILPLFPQYIPAVASHPALVERTADPRGRPVPVYFENLIRTQADDLNSQLQGRGRLHTELLLLRAVGIDVANFSAAGRLGGRFLVDAVLPIVLLIIASLLTRPPDRDRVDQFFGKLKTPVGATPELEAIAIEETRRNPHRFDHLKLMPRSSWEWTRWDRVDTIGFAVSCATTLIILGTFWSLLQWAAPSE